MKVTKDGFVWKTVGYGMAVDIFQLEMFELYVLHEDDSESLISTHSELMEALGNGHTIGIEVGRLKK
jgi:hypothetical protein